MREIKKICVYCGSSSGFDPVSMHARKHQMVELADAFIALPGGIGTAEELLEVLTWLQLELHAKPIGLLNTRGYYDHLLSFLDHMTTTGFLKKQHRAMLLVGERPETLFDLMSAFVPPDIPKVTPLE